MWSSRTRASTRSTSNKPAAKAIAVHAGRIIYVGDDTSKLKAGTRRLDLKGATVVPGLIDSHGHMAGLGDLLQSLNLRGVRIRRCRSRPWFARLPALASERRVDSRPGMGSDRVGRAVPRPRIARQSGARSSRVPFASRWSCCLGESAARSRWPDINSDDSRSGRRPHSPRLLRETDGHPDRQSAGVWSLRRSLPERRREQIEQSLRAAQECAAARTHGSSRCGRWAGGSRGVPQLDRVKESCRSGSTR